MQDKREIKIAIIVAIIMITICLIAFVTVKSKSEIKNIDIKVFKLYENTNESGDKKYEYHQCRNTSTEEQVVLYNELNKAYKLDENDFVIGKRIKGEYKVVYNSKTIAFDIDSENGNLVFRGDTERLYDFDSKVYSLVKDICG